MVGLELFDFGKLEAGAGSSVFGLQGYTRMKQKDSQLGRLRA